MSESQVNNPFTFLNHKSSGLLRMFRFVGASNKNNSIYQFWKQDYHPIELNTNEKLKERLNYLHENPLTSGLAWEDGHYKYSGAVD